MFCSVEDVEKATEEGVFLLSVQNAIFARKRDISQTPAENYTNAAIKFNFLMMAILIVRQRGSLAQSRLQQEKKMSGMQKLKLAENGYASRLTLVLMSQLYPVPGYRKRQNSPKRIKKLLGAGYAEIK